VQAFCCATGNYCFQLRRHNHIVSFVLQLVQCIDHVGLQQQSDSISTIPYDSVGRRSSLIFVLQLPIGLRTKGCDALRYFIKEFVKDDVHLEMLNRFRGPEAIKLRINYVDANI
jgi:hypothetical protein